MMAKMCLITSESCMGCLGPGLEDAEPPCVGSGRGGGCHAGGGPAWGEAPRSQEAGVGQDGPPRGLNALKALLSR